MAMSISDRLRAGIVTASAGETRTLAAELGEVLPADTTIALHGDLGVGKTTFVQGLAAGLGVGGHVTSPTFALYSVYPGRRGRLVHVDAFRLERAEQMESLLLEEFMTTPYFMAVEWPEKTGGWLPSGALHVTLSIEAGDRHRLSLA